MYRGSGMERTESGTLWLKKTGKMRWEYRSPQKLFVSDGKDAWFYVPADRQARKTAAKKLEDVRSPLAFLLGKTKLEKELQGLSLAPDVEPRQPANAIGSDCLLTTHSLLPRRPHSPGAGESKPPAAEFVPQLGVALFLMRGSVAGTSATIRLRRTTSPKTDLRGSPILGQVVSLCSSHT